MNTFGIRDEHKADFMITEAVLGKVCVRGGVWT